MKSKDTKRLDWLDNGGDGKTQIRMKAIGVWVMTPNGHEDLKEHFPTLRLAIDAAMKLTAMKGKVRK